MNIVAIILIIISILYFFDKLCLWLERKGQLYYRHKKPPGGALGSAFMELNSILQPTVCNTIEMKQNEVRLKQGKSNVPGEPLENLCYRIVKNEIIAK